MFNLPTHVLVEKGCTTPKVPKRTLVRIQSLSVVDGSVRVVLNSRRYGKSTWWLRYPKKLEINSRTGMNTGDPSQNIRVMFVKVGA